VKGLIPKYPNMEGRNEHGQTALHLASIHGHTVILEMLIYAGLGELINARDSNGHTALHVSFIIRNNLDSYIKQKKPIIMHCMCAVCLF